jgi:hypothetical protein
MKSARLLPVIGVAALLLALDAAPARADGK